MPGDPLRKVVSGEKLEIQAASYNTFVDAALANRDRDLTGDQQRTRGESERLIVEVENATGGDLTADLPIVRYTKPVFTTEDRTDVYLDEHVHLTGGTPSSSTAIDEIAVMLSPCEAGGFRKAVILGPAWVDVNVTNANHTHAKPKASTAQLDSGEQGARIIWKPTGTGVKRALVFLSPAGADDAILVKTSAGTPIPARSGINVSSRSVEVVALSGGLLGGLDAFVTVYNVADEEVPADSYFTAVLDDNSGEWVAVFPGAGTGQVILAKTSAGAPIAARSGVNVSSQSCEKQTIVAGQLGGLDTFVAVYNVADQAVPEDTYFTAVLDDTTGLWIAAFPGGGGGEAVIAKTSPGTPINARSGTTVSSQSCEIFTVVGGVLTTTSEFETVYNVGDNEIAEDSYFPAVQDRTSGLWIADGPGTGGHEALIVKTSATPIAARSGTTVSSQSCEIYEIVAGTLTTTSTNATVWNVEDRAVPASTYFLAVREKVGDDWIAVVPGGGGGESIIVKTSPGSAIAARDGVAISSQSCEVFVANVSNNLVTTSTFETVWNVEDREVPEDSYFVAVKEKNGDRWIAVVPLGFMRCRAQVKGAFSSTSSTFIVDNVVATKGPSPLSDPTDATEELTVNNEFGWVGDDNALVYIEWHDLPDGWYAYQLECPG